MDFSEIDNLLRKADVYNKPSYGPDFREYYDFMSSIKFPYAKRCKEFMKGVDVFSDDYIQKMSALHEMIIKNDSRDRYSFELEGNPEFVARDNAFWKCSMPRFGEFLQAVGILISKLNLSENVTLLEPGCGPGFLTEFLVRVGCQVDSVDVCDRFCQVVRERIRFITRLEDRISVYHTDIESYLNGCNKKYDVILFFESFHHLMNHYRILKRMVNNNLAFNGKIVLAAESIYADGDIPEDILPYEWGVRFDGESLYVMRRLGWLELGFKESYIKKMSERLGLSITKMHYKESAHAKIYVLSKSDYPVFADVTGKENRILACALKWIDLHNKQIEAANYLLGSGYETIIVYGYGRLGELFCQSLENSSVQVVAIIDKRASKISKKTGSSLFSRVEDCKELLHDCDAIIVTAVADFDEIKALLCKHTDLPIIALDSLLDKM